MARREKTYGTFSKGGDTVVAYSQARAVSLRFDGWTEQVEDAPESDTPPADPSRPQVATPPAAKKS